MKRIAALVSIAIMVTTLVAVLLIAQRGVPKVVATNLGNLPTKMDNYVSTEDRFSQAVYDELNADGHVYRHYRNAHGTQIDLYIGYYGTAKGGRTGHNPYACLPSAGWGIVETGKVQLGAQPYQNPVFVNYILAKKEDRYESVLHWYQSGGTKILQTGVNQNLHRFINRIFRNRNDGAFIRVSTLTQDNGISDAKRNISKFSDNLLSFLPHYWPTEE
jgi:EpsI family protein